eukprot:TRINITY_DN612_c0_g2_i1.p1 TRINITY_DN612_c0_g2~~TRINITY_DN612_c0_g2_i1.p1  ORF type:complete len:216 (-),score=62.99 TRINITY_DN612_c0_g2_i1:602-1222(-)
MNSSGSPPSPENHTQLIIVRGSGEEENEVETSGRGSPSTSGGVTYRVLSNGVHEEPGEQFYVIGGPTEAEGSDLHQGSPENKELGGLRDRRRDDRRRATHNEVERRRRDMINTWIMKLARLIPNLSNSSGKSNHSKGGILAKACEYLQTTKTQLSKVEELKKANAVLLKENEGLVLAVAKFKNENAALKKQVESLGVTPETIKFEL